MRRRMDGRFGPVVRRWTVVVLAAVTGLMLAVAGSTAALAVPVGGGGGEGDDPAPDPCADITATFSVSPATIYVGQPVTAQWSIQRPAGCSGRVSMLTGPGAPTTTFGDGGLTTFTPPSVGTAVYEVTAFMPGAARVVGTQSVTVSPRPHVAVQHPPFDLRFGGPFALPSTAVLVFLDLQAGESRRLVGAVSAYSDTVSGNVEYAADIACVRYGDSLLDPAKAVGYHGAAAKNFVGPGGDTVLQPKTLLTAPTTGTYTCVLEMFAEQELKARATDTYLQWDTADVSVAGFWNSLPCGSRGDWPGCTYLQPSGYIPPGGFDRTYVLDPEGLDPTQGWTAAPGAVTVNVDGTLGLTTCHKSSSCVETERSDRGDNATVLSRMEVIQRNSFGGVCNTTRTADRIDVVYNSVHHYGIAYSLPDVPVLSSCGSRVFTVRIFVELVSGDNIKIDGSVPYQVGTGETRTEAMAIDN